MTRHTRSVSLLFLLLVAPPLRADELVMIARHDLEGRTGGEEYEGWLELRADATFVAERRFDSGRVEPFAGTARIDQVDLVLDPPGGPPAATTALSLAPGSRRYARDDDGRRVRWSWSNGADEERIVQRKKQQRGWLRFFSVYLGRKGVFRWAFGTNHGKVDETPGLEVHRSKLPSPDLLHDLTRNQGLRTVVSLNGDLSDQEAMWTPPGGFRGMPVRVNLRAFIAWLGLRHVVVPMDAKRAPTDAELVSVFGVLVDDSQKPALVHCKGGRDRTGVISALYQIEFLRVSKEQAKKTMRGHMWAALGGTEIQGAYIDLYRPGRIKQLLVAAGVPIHPRLRQP